MGNQSCTTYQKSISPCFNNSPKKEDQLIPNIFIQKQAMLSRNSENIQSGDLEEMDEGSPSSKFDIKFLRTTIRASNRKHADIQFSATQPPFSKKIGKFSQEKNEKFIKKNLEQWSSNQIRRPNKLDLFNKSKDKLNAIKSYAYFISQKQNPFFEIKITGQNFYKLRQQSILPFYQINRKIGEGSFGSVYKGKCLKTGEMRAIKILKKKIMNEKDQQTLLSEINILKKMDHINIIKLYDVFFHKNFFYVVTQYCEGGSLLQALQKQLIKSQKQVAFIVRQLISAVSYMHKLKIAHRDLKLDNIVLVKQINSIDKICIKLIDFGLACEVSHEFKNKTGLVGTVSYMAPQIFTGFFSLKSDVWSCGIILCMLLIGFNPFKKKKQSYTIKSIQQQEINFKSIQWSKVSINARNLLFLMLIKIPQKRLTIDQVLNHEWLRSLTTRQTNEMNHSTYRSQFVINNFNNYHVLVILFREVNFLISRHLTQTARQQMALIFQKIDLDSSGVIEKQQLMQLYSLVTGITNQQIQKLIQKIDQNKSGKIDFQQFLICMNKNEILRNNESINQAFDFFDEDKTGYIQKQQLFQCLDGCQQQQIVRLIKQADFNGDGKISRQEFTNYLIRIQI